jgi:hypothetical protein
VARMTWKLVGSESNHLLTRGIYLASDWVPRGPIMGCHVAPQVFGFGLLIKIFMESVGFEPRTSPPPNAFTKSARPMPHVVSYYIYEFIVFKI